MTKRNLVLIAACLTVGLLLGGEVKAQSVKDVIVANDISNPVPVVIQNGTSTTPVKELVEITAEGGNGVPQVSYTVLTGKRLIITDVTMSLTGGTSISCLIQRNNVTISRPTLKNDAVFTDGSVYQRSYLSGIQFNEGDTVGLGCFQGFFELRGYLTDNN